MNPNGDKLPALNALRCCSGLLCDIVVSCQSGRGTGSIQQIAVNQGKTASDEDFPVASFLLPRSMRGPVMTFYRYARLADDIADSPTLTPERKRASLDLLERELCDPSGQSPEAAALKSALDAGGLTNRHARDLLIAFRRDAANSDCESWDALVDYCRYSAMPVGRFLLDLTGDTAPATVAASDALCAALQITNHLKDMGKDYRSLNRIYLPRDWMTKSGVTEADLLQPRMGTALRTLLARMLDETNALIANAAPLPGLITHRGLRLQAAVSLACAKRLADKLARHDPLAADLSLGRLDWLACVGQGLGAAVLR